MAAENVSQAFMNLMILAPAFIARDGMVVARIAAGMKERKELKREAILGRD